MMTQRQWRFHAVARIPLDVVRADGACVTECCLKGNRTAWYRKRRECLARRTGNNVQCLGLAGIVDDVVDKCAELRADEFDSGIRDDLYQPIEVEFSRNCHSGV